MSWSTLTTDDVALNYSESLAYRESLLAPGSEDRLPGILTSVTGQVRDAIRSHRSNTLDADATTLPAGALVHAGAIARFRLMTHFGGVVSEARTLEYKEALQYLRDVAAGRQLVEPPDSGADAAAARKARPSTSAATLTQSRADADGA